MARRLFLLAFLTLAGCRAGGPGTPALTVAQFFNKYERREGFKATDWSADLLQRLALVKAAKLLGGSELTDAITGIRAAKVISFAPTTASARELAAQGLRQEATGVLQSQKYEPLSVGSTLSNDYQVSVRPRGDRVSEFAAIGALPDVADSFVLVSVEGNFTRSQVNALAKYLPQIVQATGK
ncbi:DUF4252 domain-containing protein [uncultured Hymenobacter sp.]|uniref:DUF4252 domain-containing protein n=1 Tax=uncultured Hymenobacter sp. TaxID=170016 RepID=UPI0035C9DA3A